MSNIEVDEIINLVLNTIATILQEPFGICTAITCNSMVRHNRQRFNFFPICM